MADDAVARLNEFLREYTDEIRALTYTVMATVDARLAGATRMVYSNWNATVVGYSPDGRSRHGAIAMWEWPFDSQQPTTTVVASVSDKRRPRRPPS